jgi:glutaredoxin 3
MPACRLKKPDPAPTENPDAAALHAALQKHRKKLPMQAVKMYTTAVCPYCIVPSRFSNPRAWSRSRKCASTRPAARDHMMQTTGRRTVPQIFIGDTHVGGCDDLMALDAKGGLLPLLQS